MPAIYLSEQDCEQLLAMPSLVDELERAFRALGEGKACNVPRTRAKAKGFLLHSMTAASDDLGRAVWKGYSTTPREARFWLNLVDTASGELLAVFSADHLGRMRTGALTALAVRWLTPPSMDELGVFGTGWQAETQIMGIASVRPLKRVMVYSRDPQRRLEFARNVSARLQLEVTPAERPEDVAPLPLVVTATNSKTPVFSTSLLHEPSFIAAVGSNAVQRAELDVELFARGPRVVCDDVAACRVEAGELLAAERAGVFAWHEAGALAELIVDGVRPDGPIRQTVFKSVGLALEDLAAASLVYDLALQFGRGAPLPF